MPKTWIAALSFSAGMLFAGLLGNWVSPTYARTQSPSMNRVPDTTPDGKPRARASNISFINVVGGPPITFGEDPKLAVPNFEPINAFPILEKEYVSHATKRLDGLDCRSCTFEDATLVYGGGPFNLEDAHLSGTIGIAFEGAAVNTLNMLDFLQSVQKRNSPIPVPIADKTITRRAPIKHKPSETYSLTSGFLVHP